MKKGFTLVELLAVIVLLGGILTIAMSLLIGQIRNQEKDLEESELKMYCAAAKLYVDKNYTGPLKEVKLKILQENNILTNLSSEHINKSIYYTYENGLYCCCADNTYNLCNSKSCTEH